MAPLRIAVLLLHVGMLVMAGGVLEQEDDQRFGEDARPREHSALQQVGIALASRQMSGGELKHPNGICSAVGNRAEDPVAGAGLNGSGREDDSIDNFNSTTHSPEHNF